MKIEYLENDEQGLDSISSLWEQLNKQHETRSQHFREYYGERTWNLRKADLINKTKSGALHVDLAKDSDTGEMVGYCVSTLSKDGQGEIDSIYVELDYRKWGIGDNLMQRALHWLDNRRAKTKILVVASGNEEVLAFYSRYAFYPKHITLERVESN